MLFAIQYHFGENIDAARTGARGKHLEYLQGAGERLKIAGPLSMPADGDAPEEAKGSLLILDADSLTAAQLFAQNDPYFTAGIVADVSVTAFKGVLGIWSL